jgi:threonine/homoserine/homoserine lactone efflux protein
MNEFVQDILKAIPLGISLSFLIGPVFFVLLETSAVKGARAAIVLDLGVIFADIVFIGIAFLGSYQLLAQLTNHPALYGLGGMIMLVYGMVTIIKKPKTETIENQTEIEIPKNNYLALFVKGFLLNIINIGVLAFWLAMIVIFSPKLDLNPVRIGVFFGGILLGYFLIDLVKIILAKQFKSKMTRSRVRKIRKFIGVVLLIAGIYLIYEGFAEDKKIGINQTIEQLKDD